MFNTQFWWTNDNWKYNFLFIKHKKNCILRASDVIHLNANAIDMGYLRVSALIFLNIPSNNKVSLDLSAAMN